MKIEAALIDLHAWLDRSFETDPDEVTAEEEAFAIRQFERQFGVSVEELLARAEARSGHPEPEDSDGTRSDEGQPQSGP